MGTRAQLTRWLLISFLSVVTIFGAIRVLATGDPAIVVAAREGNFDEVRTLLTKRGNVNEPARDGSTAVLWAVYNSDVPMVRALAAAGANVNAANHYGVTP